jgi:predicted ester cyclase
MTSTNEQNLELVDSFVTEVLDSSGKDYDRIDDLFGADVVQHGSAMGVLDGRMELRAYIQAVHEGFPDLSVTEEFAFCDGDYVAARYTYAGTHEGEFMGIPATGEHVTITGNTINRIEDGEIVEVWPETDFLGLMQQVGAIPGQVA